MMATDEKCLACTHHPLPVCDGSGVRLVRDQTGRVIDAEVCPRWPASWDEPLAYLEAFAKHRIGVTPAVEVPETVWPAVRAQIARTPQQPGSGHDRGLWVVVGFFALLAVAFVAAVIRLVLS